MAAVSVDLASLSLSSASLHAGADGVEIHEPALEQRPRHRLQRRVHPPVQLDLVVQRPQHRRDGFLLGERREGHLDLVNQRR